MIAPRWLLALIPSLVPLAEEPFRELAFADALAAAKKEQKVVLVDFFTTWCPPCKMLDKVTWKDEAVRTWLGANTVALKIDAEAERELAAKYRISAYPTLVFIRPDGAEIDRIVGFKDPKSFVAEAGALLGGKTKLATLRERFDAVKGQDVDLRMELARELAQKGEYPEALQHFLWCWDHGLELKPEYAGVRGSFLLGDIVQLGARYPAALEQLRSRRDACEKELLEGRGTPALAQDLASLNRGLGDDAETLRVYDALAKLPAYAPSAAALQRPMFREILDLLLEAKRYGDVLGGVGDPGKVLETRIDMYRKALERFPAGDGNPAAFMKGQVILEGAKYFEAALGSGKTAEAGAIADQLIAFDAGRGTFEALVKHAIRGGSDATADELVGRARQILPAEDLSKLERTAQREKKRG